MISLTLQSGDVSLALEIPGFRIVLEVPDVPVGFVQLKKPDGTNIFQPDGSNIYAPE